MRKFILLILTLFLFISCEKETQNQFEFKTTTQSSQKDISILSFNIQIFGRTKASKPKVMESIIDIIDDFDIIAIQEVRDISGESLKILMSMMPKNYILIQGPREGRTFSKEQLIFIYNDTKINHKKIYNYPDLDDVFERSPFFVVFETDDKQLDFQIINVHLDPDEVKTEILHLNNIIVDFTFDEDIIILGDLNADGNYFDESELIEIFHPSKYEIIIKNDINTTVAASDNTYDRIIITKSLEKFVHNSGVLYYEHNNFKDISDHYPIYIKLRY
ncbi:MAG: endonuclease/exonuclease/phosphatase family protein [bacterium]